MNRAETVAAFLSTYPLLKGARDDRTLGFELPPMVPIFLSVADRRAWKPPRQDRFAQAVIAKMALASMEQTPPLLPGIVGRLYRAYISLAVQFHAYAALKDRYRLVVWDGVVDMEQKVDLIAWTDDGVSVGLALRCPTASSAEYASRKDRRTAGIPLPVQRLVSNAADFPAGEYWLYRPETLIAAVERAADEARSTTAEAFDAGYALALDTFARGEGAVP